MNSVNPMDVHALQAMVTVIGQALLTGRPFGQLLAQFDTGIATKLFPVPWLSAIEADHYSAEFREAWTNLSRAVRMLPPE